MLLALTGFMASGKTSVGRAVADTLGCPFLDLDTLVEKKAGCSIPQLFARDGEAVFRRIEKDVLEQTVKKYAGTTAVLALGGGTVTVPGAVALLQQKTLCIYLKTSIDTLRERLQTQGEGRPLAHEDTEALLAAREPLYTAAAHLCIETDGYDAEALADEIIIDCL